MRIVISGDGEIVYQLGLALYEQHDVVVIENDPEVAGRFDRLDVRMLHGMATHPDTLREADVVTADRFIACGSSDEINIIASLTAKRLGCQHATCFVHKGEYVSSFAGIEEGDAALAIDRVVWPQYMLAEEIARIVLVQRAIDVEIFAGGRIWLMEFKLREGSALLGRLPHLNLPRGALAVAVRKGDELTIPSGETELQVGDRVAFMGSQAALRQVQDTLLADPGATTPKRREVVIVGGGTVGLVLAKRLQLERGIRVKMIEMDRARCRELAAELPKALVLHGDGTDLELLSNEHVDRSHVLVSVTNNDEKNLLCSLLASQMQVAKIITRVNRRENVRLFERVGIDVPLNPTITAINVVLNAIQDSRLQLLATIEGGKAAVMELEVPATFSPTPLKDLPRIEGAIIVNITRGDTSLVPHGDDRVEPGDRLMIFATDAAREQLHKRF